MDTLERQISAAETRLLSQLQGRPEQLLRRFALVIMLLVGIAGAARLVAGGQRVPR